MLASPLSPSFWRIHSVYMIFRMCIFINFLVLKPMFLSSSLVYIKNSSKYHKRGKSRYLLFWWNLSNRAWFRKVFSFFLDFPFLFFPFISTCLIISASKIPIYLKFFFYLSVRMFSWFGCSIRSAVSLFPLFIISKAYFSMLNSTSIFWLYIIVCIRVSSSFSFFTNTFLSSMYIRSLIFSCNFGKFLAPWCWSLRDCKSPLVSGTLLSILACLNNVVVCLVSIPPLIFYSPSLLSTPLRIVTSAPTTISAIVTLMLPSF